MSADHSPEAAGRKPEFITVGEGARARRIAVLRDDGLPGRAGLRLSSNLGFPGLARAGRLSALSDASEGRRLSACPPDGEGLP